jgi:hypothetical protein
LRTRRRTPAKARPDRIAKAIMLILDSERKTNSESGWRGKGLQFSVALRRCAHCRERFQPHPFCRFHFAPVGGIFGSLVNNLKKRRPWRTGVIPFPAAGDVWADY